MWRYEVLVGTAFGLTTAVKLWVTTNKRLTDETSVRAPDRGHVGDCLRSRGAVAAALAALMMVVYMCDDRSPLDGRAFGLRWRLLSGPFRSCGLGFQNQGFTSALVLLRRQVQGQIAWTQSRLAG